MGILLYSLNIFCFSEFIFEIWLSNQVEEWENESSFVFIILHNFGTQSLKIQSTNFTLV